MSKRLVEQLYDIANVKGNDGLSKFDEQKLKRALENNDKLLSKNKDLFRDEPRFSTCSLYDPCPLCDKCRAKASHLYVRCQECQIPICVHTHQNKENMLKRKNFTIKVKPETFKQLINGGKADVGED